MKLKSFALLLLSIFILAAAPVYSSDDTTKASPHVQELIKEHQLEVVDYDYVKAGIGNGTRGGAESLLIDARPHLKYLKGTIPSSISIPDTQIDKYIDQLDTVAKDREIIVFCGGWKCEKSPIVAGYLKNKGYSDVKLYQAGTPEWSARSYTEVGLPVVQSAMEKNSALLMDARPYRKFLAETIPGSIAMYDKEIDTLAGRFPRDKSTSIIAFCGGYQCDKSHIVAERLLEEGYSNVSVFAAGLPAWKKADLATTAGGAGAVASIPAAEAEVVMIDGVKAGIDEGTVDGEWYKAHIEAGTVPAAITLIDVRAAQDFSSGHIPGAINIPAADLNADELAAALPKDKVAVMVCGSGARAMESYYMLKDAGENVDRVMYFDANVSCEEGKACTIEVNEPLG